MSSGAERATHRSARRSVELAPVSRDAIVVSAEGAGKG